MIFKYFLVFANVCYVFRWYTLWSIQMVQALPQRWGVDSEAQGENLAAVCCCFRREAFKYHSMLPNSLRWHTTVRHSMQEMCTALKDKLTCSEDSAFRISFPTRWWVMTGQIKTPIDTIVKHEHKQLSFWMNLMKPILWLMWVAFYFFSFLHIMLIEAPGTFVLKFQQETHDQMARAQDCPQSACHVWENDQTNYPGQNIHMFGNNKNDVEECLGHTYDIHFVFFWQYRCVCPWFAPAAGVGKRCDDTNGAGESSAEGWPPGAIFWCEHTYQLWKTLEKQNGPRHWLAIFVLAVLGSCCSCCLRKPCRRWRRKRNVWRRKRCAFWKRRVMLCSCWLMENAAKPAMFLLPLS